VDALPGVGDVSFGAEVIFAFDGFAVHGDFSPMVDG
jgi:hypothetical protein